MFIQSVVKFTIKFVNGGWDFLEIPPLSEKVLEGIFSSLLMRFFFSDSGGSFSDSTHSFLFSFKNRYGLDPFKLHIKYSKHAIYGDNSYGPTFGAGHDIYIADNAGSNTNSIANVGHDYVQPAGYKYNEGNTPNLLAGSYNFQPHEVEVFYQTFKK